MRYPATPGTRRQERIEPSRPPMATCLGDAAAGATGPDEATRTCKGSGGAVIAPRCFSNLAPFAAASSTTQPSSTAKAKFLGRKLLGRLSLLFTRESLDTRWVAARVFNTKRAQAKLMETLTKATNTTAYATATAHSPWVLPLKNLRARSCETAIPYTAKLRDAWEAIDACLVEPPKQEHKSTSQRSVQAFLGRASRKNSDPAISSRNQRETYGEMWHQKISDLHRTEAPHEPNTPHRRNEIEHQRKTVL